MKIIKRITIDNHNLKNSDCNITSYIEEIDALNEFGYIREEIKKEYGECVKVDTADNVCAINESEIIIYKLVTTEEDI